MNRLKKVDNKDFIENLFKNLSKQKIIPVTIKFKGKKITASLSFSQRKGICPIITVTNDDILLQKGEKLSVRLYDSEIALLFKTYAASSYIDNSFDVQEPETVYTLFRRTIKDISKPEIVPLEYISTGDLDSIIRYQESKSGTSSEIIRKGLNKIKGEYSIFAGYAYKPEDRILGYDTALRVYSGTFIGKPAIFFGKSKFDSKPWRELYTSIAGYLLNIPGFKNYIVYIPENNEWQTDVFQSAEKFVGDPEKLCIDTKLCYKYSISQTGIVSNGLGLECSESHDQESFLDYCSTLLKPLIIDAFDYNKTDFFLDEINSVYGEFGYTKSRKLFKITKDDEIIAYAVAETSPDELGFTPLNDRLRVYHKPDSIDIVYILQALLPEASRYFFGYGKNEFNILLDSNLQNAGNNYISGMEFEGKLTAAIMDKRGLLEYKKLLNDNFINLDKYYRLSHPQLAIWYTEKTYPGTSIDNISSSARLHGDINYTILEQAINLFIENNEGIRLRLVESDGIPQQYVSKYKNTKFHFYDFSSNEGEADLIKLEESNNCIPFDIIDTDLFYFALYKINNYEGGFYFRVHHIVSDGWSSTWLVSEIVNYYSRLKNCMEIDKLKKPSYLEYLNNEDEFKSSRRFLTQKEFWDNKFKTIPECSSVKPRSSGHRTIKSERKRFILDKELTGEINKYFKETKISPFIVFLASLYIYIHRLTSKKDIVLGTPVLNRSNTREKETFGMYISVIPFRVNVDPEVSFYSLAENLTKEWMMLLKNQRYPFSLILKNYRERHKVTDNLYDISISYQNAKFDISDLTGNYGAKWCFNRCQIEALQIHISDREDEGRYEIDFDYLVNIFDAYEIDKMFNCMHNILTDVMKNPSNKISQIELLSENEKTKLIKEFNKTEAYYPKDKTIKQVFEEQAEKKPDCIAVVYENEKLTFRELNYKANQLARILVNKGVKPDTIVGLMVERSLEMIIGIFAILKAGGAYLPIDPGYPEDRVKYMLEDSRALVLLTQKHLADGKKLPEECIYIDNNLLKGESDNLPDINKPNDLCYVIYTSGSTGKPKGVMIEHKSVLNLVNGLNNTVYNRYGSDIKIALVAPYVFDASIQHIFSAPLLGHSLYIVPEAARVDGVKLLEYLNLNEIIVSDGTPMHVKMLLNVPNFKGSSIFTKHFIIGGEELQYKILENFYNRFKLDNPVITNVYGPTECCVDSTYYNITRDTLKSVSNIPIGAPLQNMKIYILDNNMRMVPVGVTGELYISGAGLSRGYLNRHDLNEEKFIPDIFCNEEKMYKSGDLGRWLPDGNIEFLGRADSQVKIRGYRIELGEIENELLNYPAVKEAVVTGRMDDSGNKYICAYYVSEKDDIPVSELRGFLMKKLPIYMIPSYFIRIDKVNLTKNGKVDKDSLPEPGDNINMSAEYIPPSNEAESILASLFEKELGIGRIGIDDNIFELGCDSLAIIVILTETINYNWNISMQDFYTYQTIRELAAKINGTCIIEPDEREETVDLIIRDSNSIRPVLENIKKTRFNNILLTGATGFLGIHILDRILTSTHANVYCIIRGISIELSVKKLLDRLNYYFGHKYDNLINKRIFVLNGDTTIENLGLSEAKYAELGNLVDNIFHAAAIVKHYGNYDDFIKINVFGTGQVIKFAKEYGIKLNHISTVSVSGDFFPQKEKGLVFSENDLYIGQNFDDNVYIKSKFEAENLILKEIKNGLEATVYRVGNLTGRYEDGLFQVNVNENKFYNVLRFILEVRIIPEDMFKRDLEFTPVDLCSKAVFELARSNGTSGRVYHIFNHNYVKLDSLLSVVNMYGKDIRVVSNFNDYISTILKDKTNKEIFSRIVSDFSMKMGLQYRSTVEVNSDITIETLSNLGFQWPAIDEVYIEKILKHLESIGYIKSLVS